MKVRISHFSIAWFRAEVDLPKKNSYGNVLFSSQLIYHLMRNLLKNSSMLSNQHVLPLLYSREYDFYRLNMREGMRFAYLLKINISTVSDRHHFYPISSQFSFDFQWSSEQINEKEKLGIFINTNLGTYSVCIFILWR